MEGNEVKDSILLFREKLENLIDLTIEERGLIMTAIMDYMNGNDVPEMKDRAVRMAWREIANQLGRSDQKYEDKVKARSEAGKKGAAARWQNDGKTMAKMANDGNAILPDGKNSFPFLSCPDPVPDPVPDPSPVPTPGDGKPTAEEVEEYARSLGAPNFIGKVFIDYYEERGWKINGEPIRDWRALVRRWIQHDEKKQTSADVARKKPNGWNSFDQRTDDLDDETIQNMKRQHDEFLRRQQKNEDQPEDDGGGRVA